jgi:hypothetical protein
MEDFFMQDIYLSPHFDDIALTDGVTYSKYRIIKVKL